MTQQYPAPSPEGSAHVPPGSGPAAPHGAAPAAPPTEPKKRSRLPRILISLVLAAAIAGAGLWLARDEPANAKVGDCIAGKTAEDMTIVDCGSAEAEHKVIARVEDKAEGEMQSACQAYEQAESTFWQGEAGKKGVVLCLAPAD